MRKAYSLFVIFLMLLAVTEAFSAEINVNKKSIAFLNSMEFKTQLYNLGIYWDRKVLNLETACTSKYNLIPISFGIVKPLIFDDGDVQPKSGVWTYRYRFVRCGKTIVYNALAIAKKGAAPKLMLMVPGYTRVSPTLLRDVIIGGVSAGAEMGAKDNKACKKVNVLDTAVTMKPTTLEEDGISYNGVWEELWTVQRCGEEISMNFCFVPTADGGTDWSLKKCR